MSFNGWQPQNENRFRFRASEGPPINNMMRPERPNANTVNSAPPRHFPYPPLPQNNFPPFFNQRPPVPYDLSQQYVRSSVPINIPPPFTSSNPPPHFQSQRPPFQLQGQTFPPVSQKPMEYRNPGSDNFMNLQVPPPNFNIGPGPVQNNFSNPPNTNIFAGNLHLDQGNVNIKITESEQQLGPKQIGHQLLEKWCKDKSKTTKAHPSNDKKETNDKLWPWMNQLRELMQVLTSMSTRVQYMTESISSLDNSSWDKSVSDFEALKGEYVSFGKVLDEETICQHEIHLKLIQKKRKRLARRRINLSEHKINKWDEKNKQIDQWQERIQAKIREENIRKARKEAADRTLSKVTKEIQDASRLIETMLALKKLRLIRRDAAQKRGESELGESRQCFEDKIADMTRLVQAQLECYKEEEARLKEVIQSEQNERSEKERLLQATSKEQKEKEEDHELQTLLFGPQEPVLPSDPLYPFVKFYDQGKDNLQAFIQIRREWDSFIVPDTNPASSVVPMSWVIPEAPSSLAWAQALK